MESFKFKKKYGQNFIKDKNIVKKIVEYAALGNNDLIIEVGPGKGILTEELIKTNGNVISYEIDNELKKILDDKFKHNNNFELIMDDFLNRDITRDIKNYKYENLYFIANVPYYITTPIIMKLIDSKLKFNKIIMMVQKELGERLCANPATKDYSSITVFLNYYFNIEKVFDVNRNEFIPEPNVDSVVISFKRKENLLYVKDFSKFEKLVKDSFQYKRKNLRNNLKNYDLEKIQKIINKYNMNLTNRAEEIPLELFVEISNELNN